MARSTTQAEALAAETLERPKVRIVTTIERTHAGQTVPVGTVLAEGLLADGVDVDLFRKILAHDMRSDSHAFEAIIDRA